MAPRNQKDPIAAQWQFLNRTDKGPAIFVVKEAKLGRATSVVHITLYQGNLLQQHPWVSEKSTANVVGYITNGSLEREKGVTVPTRFEIAANPAPADLHKLPLNQDPNWERMHMIIMTWVPMMENIEWFHPRAAPSNPATYDFWIRQASGERFTTTSLGYVADIGPPLIVERFRPEGPDAVIPEGGFAFDKVFWYPTVAMSLEVKKALPLEGEEWLRLRIAAKVIHNGRYDAEVIIFDPSGDIVGLSNHVALAVDGARNFSRGKKL